MNNEDEKSKTYVVNQIKRAAKDHDWTYNVKIKVSGLNDASKWVDLTKKQYQQLLKIFK